MKINVNYNLIKKSAYDTVNKLQFDPSGQNAQQIYNTYLTEGKKAPGYAVLVMQTAKYDQFWQSTNKVMKGHISSQSYNERKKNIANGLLALFFKNENEELELNKAGEKMYPKTWAVRKQKGVGFKLSDETSQKNGEYIFD